MFIGDTEVSSVYYGNAKVYENYIDEERQYLTFVPVSDATFTWTNHANSGSLYYSLNNGSTWTALGDGESTPMITSGNKILWKGNLVPNTNGIGTFSSDADYNASGNIMSLLYYDNYYNSQLDSTKHNYAFRRLFENDTHILSAPVLPATTLAVGCYYEMFYNCTSLISASELPATTLAAQCYQDMFRGCTSLTTAPELPATTLAVQCYQLMFGGCTSLTAAPVLPATTLATDCYSFMFYGCTRLIRAPELPATTLTGYCYSFMFENCTSLTAAPALPATTLETNCYRNMFYGCTRLIRAPELPATTLETNCYREMFYGCTRLNYIKCLATNISASNSLARWVTMVPFTGAFVKAADMKSWTRGGDGIPPGWTVVDA